MAQKKDINLDEAIKEQLAVFDFEVGTQFEDMSRGAVDDFDKFTEVKSVLELGCGDGAAIKRFLELGYIVEGVDVNPLKIEKCPEGASVVTGDILSFLNSKEENSVENIFTHHVLEHTIHYGDILKEVNRVLKKGGLFMCVVPAFDHIHSVHHVEFNDPRDVAVDGFEELVCDLKHRIQPEFHYVGRKVN